MEKLLTIEQMAEITGWNKRTIQNKICNGTMPIPFIKLQGTGGVRFRPSVVENYFNKRTINNKRA